MLSFLTVPLWCQYLPPGSRRVPLDTFSRPSRVQHRSCSLPKASEGLSIVQCNSWWTSTACRLSHAQRSTRKMSQPFYKKQVCLDARKPDCEVNNCDKTSVTLKTTHHCLEEHIKCSAYMPSHRRQCGDVWEDLLFEFEAEYHLASCYRHINRSTDPIHIRVSLDLCPPFWVDNYQLLIIPVTL